MPELVELIRRPPLRFIKWDARPANAVLHPGGGVGWFDWEHCGYRAPLDDLVWLLCDEWTPEAQSERALAHAASLAAPEQADPERYTRAMGVLHTCWRMALILDLRADGDWWDEERCAWGERPGVTASHFARLCRRGAWLSDGLPGAREIRGWLSAVEEAAMEGAQT